MRKATVAAFALMLLVLAASALPVSAQIVLNQNGNVSMGASAGSLRKLSVLCDGLEGCTNDNGRYTYGYGVQGASSGHSRNRGLYGYAAPGAGNPSSTVIAYGVVGDSRDGDLNYGLYGLARGGGTTYGVFGYARNGEKNYAGYFSGDVHVSGELTTASDAMFKRDVEGLGEGGGPSAPQQQATFSGTAAALGGGGAPRTRSGEGPPPSEARAKLLQLRPVRYHYRRAEYEQMGFPEGEHYGFVAQEVEGIFPEIVSESVHPGMETLDEDGEAEEESEPLTYKSVSYVELVPVLVQTAKEQQAEIDALREAVEALQDLVENDDDDDD